MDFFEKRALEIKNDLVRVLEYIDMAETLSNSINDSRMGQFLKLKTNTRKWTSFQNVKNYYQKRLNKLDFKLKEIREIGLANGK